MEMNIIHFDPNWNRRKSGVQVSPGPPDTITPIRHSYNELNFGEVVAEAQECQNRSMM